ncbi:MAG: hypothetical protein IH600_11455 [Bacteroidetes bacterium]|nr:hypothetical protein [Bacteroidota bacterium]
MNERIQELISAYLHRGSTPEQERELFEACSRNPETAELLRQHLVLSLKLRGLREEVQVPADLQNNVLRRINTLEAEGLRSEEMHAASEAATEPRRRFGFAHLLGTGLATAACAITIMLWSAGPDTGPDASLQQVAQVQDTVYIVEKDTVMQLREVERPVYIVRNAPVAPAPESPASNDAADLARAADDRVAATEPGTALATRTQPDAAVPPSPAAVETEMPLIAEMQPREATTREAKTENYIDQYNSMLVSVETVQLSAKDRIH